MYSPLVGVAHVGGTNPLPCCPVIVTLLIVRGPACVGYMGAPGLFLFAISCRRLSRQQSAPGPVRSPFFIPHTLPNFFSHALLYPT